MTNYERMTNTKVEKLCFELSIPTIISMLVSSIYNMADTYFVSKINDSTSAAVSVVFSVMTLIQSFGYTIGMGSGSIISRALGRKNQKLANQHSSQAFFCGLFFGILFLTFGLVFNRGIMKLLGASDTSLEYSIVYSRWIFIASPFMMLSFIMSNFLRYEGKTNLSMIGISSGSILNIILDPIFIFALDLGISGAGIATMISQIFSFTILLSFFLFKKSSCVISVKYLSRDIKSYLEAFKCGTPTLCRQGFGTTSNIIMNLLAKPYGDAVVAALGITNKIYTFVRSVVVGFGQGFQPVLGFSYGAGLMDRIKKGLRFTVILQTVFCLICSTIVLIFPKELISLFRDSEGAISVGTKSIRFLAISMPFLGLSTTINQVLQVTGYSKSASFLASLRQGLVYTPLIFILEATLKDTGLCLNQPMSDLITTFISLPFYFYFYKALKKEEERLNALKAQTE